MAAELVTKLYEAAVKKVPLSEEYHSHLFMAYARVGEYKKMQQVRKQLGSFKSGHTIRIMNRVSVLRQEWPCIKSSPRIPITSGLS